MFLDCLILPNTTRTTTKQSNRWLSASGCMWGWPALSMAGRLRLSGYASRCFFFILSSSNLYNYVNYTFLRRMKFFTLTGRPSKKKRIGLWRVWGNSMMVLFCGRPMCTREIVMRKIHVWDRLQSANLRRKRKKPRKKPRNADAPNSLNQTNIIYRPGLSCRRYVQQLQYWCSTIQILHCPGGEGRCYRYLNLELCNQIGRLIVDRRSTFLNL